MFSLEKGIFEPLDLKKGLKNKAGFRFVREPRIVKKNQIWTQTP
jgi:hypothetical protein